jgi:hypothetical protein
MKVGIATTLSIAGVLAAGAAAYAVNSSVLGASSSVSPTTSGTPAVIAPTALPAQVAAQSTKVQSSVLNNTTTTYQVGTAGSVVLDMRSGAIAVNNVLPAAGWSSEPAQVQPNGDVKVPFISTSTRLEFLARLVDGKVTVNVTSRPIAPPKPKPTYSDDDDDDDDDHDDKKEHERDDEKEHEHDEDEDDD